MKTDARILAALGATTSALLTVVFCVGGGIQLPMIRQQVAAAQESGGAAEGDPAISDAIEAVLRRQEAAWNGGDVDGFVEHYWKSDDVTFSGGGKTTRGWTATRDRYRERYPTREAMGQLSFDSLEVTPLGDGAALVLGEWALARDEDPVGGNFTLVMRKVDGRWVIIHDHTSQLAE